MSNLVHLEAFLDDQADDGDSLGEAEFTVNRNGALKKLAQHSLPFAGAWLLKAVQAAVSSGCEFGIKVSSTRNETVVRFDTKRAWTGWEVTQAFFDPDPSQDEVLDHLKMALWGAGISARHPFELHLPAEAEALIWSGGSELARGPSKAPPGELILTVLHGILGDPPLGFFARKIHASKVNAETMAALSNNAYTCPAPLVLDGRRLDSLLLAPLYFDGKIAQPVELGFLDDADCPTWRLPLGTFDAFRKRPYQNKTAAVDRLAVAAVAAANQVATASIAFLYVAHIGKRPTEKSTVWEKSSSKSNLFWVKDGVLVRHEVFPMQPTSLSLTCYVSAEGLQTDLTTLQLVASDPKALRTAEVIRAMSSDLLKARKFAFEPLLSDARKEDKITAGVLGVMGVLTLPALPIGLLFLWTGHRTITEAGEKVAEFVDDIVKDYSLLQDSWRTAHAAYLPAGQEIAEC